MFSASLFTPARRNRGLWAFGLGGLLALAVTALVPRLLFGILSPRYPSLQALLPSLQLGGQMAAYFMDGAVGAALLGGERRGVVGFGIGFAAAGYFMQRTFFFVRFLPPGMGEAEIVLRSAGLFAAGFGLAVIGCLSMRFPFRIILRTALALLIAAALGGSLLVLPFLVTVPPGAVRLDTVFKMFATPPGFLLPHIAAGVLVERALAQTD